MEALREPAIRAGRRGYIGRRARLSWPRRVAPGWRTRSRLSPVINDLTRRSRALGMICMGVAATFSSKPLARAVSDMYHCTLGVDAFRSPEVTHVVSVAHQLGGRAHPTENETGRRASSRPARADHPRAHCCIQGAGQSSGSASIHRRANPKLIESVVDAMHGGSSC
jgi:hypothetical protein